MKRFQKLCLIAVCLLVVGSCMIGVGAAFGVFERSPEDWNLVVRPHSSEIEELTESYEEVDELDFELDFCDVVIQRGDKFSITSSSDRSFESYVKNGKWKIELKNGVRLFGFNSENENNKVQITLPDTILKKIKIDVGAGSLEADAVQTERLEVEVGLGSAEFTNAVVKKAEMECGMGTLTYSGSIEDDTSIECDMGEVKAELTGREEDYQYDLQCDLGTIVLNDVEHHGIDKKINSENKHAPKIKIECDMGRAELIFQNP